MKRHRDTSLSKEMERRLAWAYRMPRRKRKLLAEEKSPESFQQMVEQFFEALISKDFDNATRVSHMELSAALKAKQYVRVVSVGQPFQLKGFRAKRYAGGQAVHVPFEVEEADGSIYRAVVNMRWNNPQGEWIFDGGF